jgi:outer membrane lipoprotein-sorting protein
LVKSSRRTQIPLITRTATLGELLAKLERLGEIRTMKASVELRLSVESEDRSRVQELRDAPGFVVARRPSEILTIAQLPVVRSTAFQMASNGETYQVHLPSRKQFFVGKTALDERSEKRIENIRPQHILEALLIEPPKADELAVLENVVEGLTPYQVVYLVRRDGNQKPKLTRKFWFARETLELTSMQILDDRSETATLARYEEWSDQDLLHYPAIITVTRPDDGYSLRIHFLQPGLNETVPEDSFVLKPPEGVTVEQIGEAMTEQAEARPEANTQ